ncbi:MAG: DinB family protein [Chloroflexota bacterium]|nr:DinB family protein [Chloroflexota bacterium]
MAHQTNERPALLAEYLEATYEIEVVLEELSESELEARESPDEWSVRQVVHHLADVEVGDAMRLRQMLAHDSPLIVAYDEDRFATRLHYDRPIESSVATFFALRTSNGALLERITEADWSRPGRHEEHDRYTVEILVRRSIDHDRLHLGQIRRALDSST